MIYGFKDDEAEFSFKVPEKFGRGMARDTIDIIGETGLFLKKENPTTVRGVAYKLFTLGLIPHMSQTGKVSRILTQGREEGYIPWEWIVDETRELEIPTVWPDLAVRFEAMRENYRRDYWEMQPTHVELWSEKGTQRQVLAGVLDRYAIGFRVLHGFNSATAIHDIAEYSRAVEKPFVALYMGDWDPSGMFMSEEDLPNRLGRYGAAPIEIRRIAVTEADTRSGIPSFQASDKSKDPNFRWFLENHCDGASASDARCWELDAIEPHVLRGRLEAAIEELIDWDRWGEARELEAEDRDVLASMEWPE